MIVLGLVAALYIGWCAMLFFSQDRLIFPARFAGPASAGMPNEKGIEQLWLEPEPGVRVEAWLVRAPRAEGEAGARPLAVFFHGNAELIEFDLDVARMYRRLGFDVLMPEYRGYGRSTGVPGERAIAEDALALIAMAVERGGIDEDRIVYHGRSIGGGVACAVAARTERFRPAAMVLESTFVSVARMTRRYGVPSFLVKHPFRNDRALAAFEGPVLLMHGSDDRIVPAWHSRRLHEIARRSTLVEVEAGHNNFPPDWGWFEGEVGAFLRGAGVVGSGGNESSKEPGIQGSGDHGTK